MWNYFLAFVVGLLLGGFIVGSLYLGYAWFARVTDDGADLPPGSVGSEAVTPFVPAAEDLEAMVADVDPLDPDTRVLLGLKALTLYESQGGDPRLLSLLRLADSDYDALAGVPGWDAVQRGD